MRARAVLVAAVSVAAVAAVTGCNTHLYGNLANRAEAVAEFSPTAPAAEHVHALKACSGLPGTQAEPLPGPNAPVASQINDVRFLVGSASNFELNRLYTCLARQPGVIGVQTPDTDMN